MKLLDAIRADAVEDVRAALKKIKDINKDLPNALSPIQEAAKANAVKSIEVLLDAGANPHHEGLPLASALAQAANDGHAEAVALFLSRVKWSKDELNAAAEMAGMHNRVAILPLLKKAKADMTEAAEKAVAHSMVETLRWCLENGVDANAAVVENRGGVKSKRTLLHVAADSASPAVVPILLAAGAQIDARDSRGRTPLMVAAINEPSDTMDRLMLEDRVKKAKRQGGDVSTNLDRRTNATFTVFDALLDAGADARLADSDGNDTMRLFLAENERQLNSKLSKDDDAAYRRMWEMVQHFNQRLTKSGAGGGKASAAKDALFKAIAAKDVKGVQAALKAGADVSSRDTSGWSPLGLAALKGDVAVVHALLEAGADVNDGGRAVRPLNKAAHVGHLEVVKLLVERGADVNLIDPEPRDDPYNALYYAKVNDKEEVVEYLKSVGARLPAVAFEPFSPGVELPDSFVEAFVNARPAVVAKALAEIIDGTATPAVWEKNLKAGKTSYAIIQLDGSDWSSVLGVTGTRNQIDTTWEKVSADISKRLKTRTILIEHEDVSGHTGYRIYENGKPVEHFEAGDEDLYQEAQAAGVKVKKSLKTGTFRSKGKVKPKEPSLHELAERLGFRTLNYGPAAEPGRKFDFELLGLDMKVAAAAYVTT